MKINGYHFIALIIIPALISYFIGFYWQYALTGAAVAFILLVAVALVQSGAREDETRARFQVEKDLEIYKRWYKATQENLKLSNERCRLLEKANEDLQESFSKIYVKHDLLLSKIPPDVLRLIEAGHDVRVAVVPDSVKAIKKAI